MAMAFSAQERQHIREKLLSIALDSIAAGTMRQTTVDQLAQKADISKGAFYHFYPSKEHLFLSALEALHNEMYGRAEKVLQRQELDIRQRTKLAILEVFHLSERYNTISFIREDFPLLRRRLPAEVLREHYISDDERIRKLIVKAGVTLRTDLETACTTMHLLLFSQLMQKEAGQRYEQAVELMIEGVCDRAIAE